MVDVVRAEGSIPSYGEIQAHIDGDRNHSGSLVCAQAGTLSTTAAIILSDQVMPEEPLRDTQD